MLLVDSKKKLILPSELNSSLVTTKKTEKIDALAHVIVPFHTILTKSETTQLLKDYSIRLVNLPRIFTDDPTATGLGACEGDVLKIIRKSSTTVDKIETYRFCVKRRTD